VHVTVLTDRTAGIRASVSDVRMELVLAVVLVVLVIFLFLARCAPRWWPALRCRSLVGAFAAMYFLDFRSTT
jgi:multidrug efflux pump